MRILSYSIGFWLNLLSFTLILGTSISPVMGQGSGQLPPEQSIPAYQLVLMGDVENLTAAEKEFARAFVSAQFGVDILSVTYNNTLSHAEVQEFLEGLNNVEGGGGVLSPVDANGNAIPPPVLLPPGPNGEENEWVRVPGTPARPVKWKPRFPVPGSGGGQPSGSWDPNGEHWDVDNGQGTRTRIKPDGTIVDHDNVPQPDQNLPVPFPGPDLNIVAIFSGIGLVAVLATIIFAIWNSLSGWGVLLSVLPPSVLMPVSTTEVAEVVIVEVWPFQNFLTSGSDPSRFGSSARELALPMESPGDDGFPYSG